MSFNILVIEDEVKSYQLIADLCADHGHETMHTVDGEQGIVMARDEQPDIILLDLMLPMMSGWEVARVLKTSIITKHIPLIAVSAQTSIEDRKRAFEMGCDAFVDKPFSVNELRQVIQEQLQAHQ